MKTIAFILLILGISFYACKKNCFESERCQLEPDPGNCKAYVQKYYFDKDENKCKEFIWGGCDGVVPFDTMDECRIDCECGFD